MLPAPRPSATVASVTALPPDPDLLSFRIVSICDGAASTEGCSSAWVPPTGLAAGMNRVSPTVGVVAHATERVKVSW